MPPMDRLRQLEERLGAFGRFMRRWVERFLEIEGIDRGIVLGAQTFTALFPLLITYSAVVGPDGGGAIVQRLIDRFDLQDNAADSLTSLFSASDGARGQATLIGGLLVIVTALAFARAMQRLYEHAFQMEKLGLRVSGWGLLWLAGLAAWLALQPTLDDLLPVGINALVSLALVGGLWLLTPYLLLARRLSWLALAPCALLTTVAMTIAGVASVVAMPRLITSSAEEFGTIGVAFALIAWLTALGWVLTVSAAGGAVLEDAGGFGAARERLVGRLGRNTA